MATLERSTELLANASDADALTAIAHELGFVAAPLALDLPARSNLGLPAHIGTARVARGTGDLRALLVELRSDCDGRETLRSIAATLARRTPQLLWTVLACYGDNVAIICWSAARSGPRVVSLVCQRHKVFTSDAETLCSLSAAVGESDLLTHARWLDILGRESITRKFFRELEATVGNLADSLGDTIAMPERRELGLVYLSRLIFLSFLESKGWLDGDFGFLENGFVQCMTAGGNYQRRVLEPLFFGTLNTRMSSRARRARKFGRIPFLNGGLFARSALEKRTRGLAFSDESFGNAYGALLSRYRFTGREDSADWSETAIDPEILGKAFEALMASSDRKGTGSFYTPQELVEHVTDEALASALRGSRDLEALLELRVIDPACGSGAFLVHVLERLAKMRIELGETGSVGEVRRRVLASSIFGVDLNPTAVWLCELRLWLSVVVETGDADFMRIPPLPNLDRHIRIGDSLAGGGLRSDTVAMSGKKLHTLRSRYMRASGPRKRTLSLALDRHERNAALMALERALIRLGGERKELLLQLRSRDLFGARSIPDSTQRPRLAEVRREIRATASRVRVLRSGGALPFSFEAHFADAGAAGGFDVVIGNPPWVRLHNIEPSSRERLRRDFRVYREAPWRLGAELSGAGRGFAAQVDMAALFVERSQDLLKPGGTMALLLPSKLWRCLAGGGVRALLADKAELVLLEDHAADQSSFDAAVYPSLLVCRHDAESPRNGMRGSPALMRCEVRSRERACRWTSPPADLSFDRTPGSPWLLMPPDARKAFDRVRDAGTPLAGSMFGRPLLGVKTGCNEAFLVHVESLDAESATINGNSRADMVERELLRRTVRGESLSAFAQGKAAEHIIWPHDAHGRPLASLPPLARRWFVRYHDRLSQRSDLHGRKEWWSAFRVESACSTMARVIWADIGRRPQAIVSPPGDDLIPLNTCYAVRAPSLADARALAALLNSPLAAAWLDAIAEPARGGYRRFLGWTMSLFPIPQNWDAARTSLGAIDDSADARSDALRLASSLTAYGLRRVEVEPLLEWTHRSS
ncbi:MAG TPA: N-6 DNA methylase [Gemmatimonadaceae bacterium]|nr:N-6 DNA methylase [Gemmatimonadaceae bacterium]